MNVTSFTLPAECSTLQDAEQLVRIWEGKLAKLPPGVGPRSKYAKACGDRLRAARFRVEELKEVLRNL